MSNSNVLINKFILICLFSINIFSIEKPNVVIILTDDLGWGDVSYNGGPIPTPNIDKLSNDGIRMNRFYSAPTCSPTRAALFTGLNSLTNGIIRPLNNPTAERYALSLEHKIMPEYFKEMGYKTALSGKWHLGMYKDEYLPRNRGFDSTYGQRRYRLFWSCSAGRLDWHRNGEILYEDGIQNDDEAGLLKIKIVLTYFYMYFNAPHTPIEAENNVINELLNIKDEKERKYAANIISLDREIGKIINTIESEGILEETIIIFFSDNGPVFDIDPIAATIAPDILDSKGNTLGLKGSKGSAYEGGIRVPGIIYYKGVLEKSISNQFFFSDDILPTLLTAVGYDKDRNFYTGVDRWESLKSNNIEDPINVITGNVIVNDERALFNNQWKLYYSHFIHDNNLKKYLNFTIFKMTLMKNNLSSDTQRSLNQWKIH